MGIVILFGTILFRIREEHVRSTEWKMNPKNISFKSLEIEDLDLLYKWLNNPYVKEWYSRDEKTDLESIKKKYLPRIKGKENVKCFIVYYDNEPFGFIQTYKISKFPEYAKFVDIDFEAASVDLFIGEKDFMNKGLGSEMLKKFLKEIVFKEENINTCLIGPETKNIRAIKSYEKTGFKYFKTIKVPKESEPEYLMRIDKEGMPGK